MIWALLWLVLMAFGVLSGVAYSMSITAEWRRYLRLTRRRARLSRRFIDLEIECDEARHHLADRLAERQRRESAR